MKKIYRYILGALLIAISFSLLATKFDREYITFSPQEGDVGSVILKSGGTYQQTFTVTRRSISQMSLPVSRAVVSPVTESSIELTILRDNEVLAVEQINPSIIKDDGSTQVKFAKPITTKPGQEITLSLNVPSILSGSYRTQLSLPTEKQESANASFYIGDELQDKYLAFNVFYVFRPPLSYQMGTLLFLLSIFIILNLSLKSRAAIILYTVALSAAYIYPVVALGNFSLLLLGTFTISFVGMFLFLRKLKFSLPAILLGAHMYAFTTYFPLHISAGREKLLCFAFLPFIFYFFYPLVGDYKRKIKLSLLMIFIMAMLVVFLPYEAPPVTPIHTANLKDIFLDPNQIPTGDKFHAAYYVLQIPKGDPSVIDYYGGWDNFGSYIGFINMGLAFIGIIFGGKRYWSLLVVGAIGLLISTAQFVTPYLATVMLVPPQYFIIITTFSLSVFAAVGLKTLWRFLRKDPLTNVLIIMIVFFALLDLLNVTSKTLQFGLL
jgi:hypothetical protein